MSRNCRFDDQTLVGQGIRSLLALADGMAVVGEAGDGKQAVELVPGLKPDVVLMDMRMPAMSGLEALQALARMGAQIGRAHVELQSLMRNSYAGFCLKKQKTHNSLSNAMQSIDTGRI